MNKNSYYRAVLNKDSYDPLYYQIYRIMKEEIENEEYVAGDFLPSETFLIKAFDVSKVTIRKAMDLLESERYITREQGRGTRVLDYKDSFYWSNLTSFTLDLREQTVTSILVDFDEIIPSVKISNLLGIGSEEYVYKLERIRLINGKRIALSTSYLVKSIPIELKEEMFTSETSLFQLLRDSGIELGTCDETVEARIPTFEIKKILEMDSNTAIFYRERVTYDVNNNPIEFVTISYNANYNKYFVKSRIAEREKLLSAK